MSVSSEEIILKGMRQVTDSPNGGIGDVMSDWTGVMALLLRKIISDQYVGKGKEGYQQLSDNKITYTQFEEMVEEYIKETWTNVSEKELLNAKTHLMTAFSQKGISVKTLGEFLSVLNPDSLIISITITPKGSNEMRTYAQSIGRFMGPKTELKTFTPEMVESAGLVEEKFEVSGGTIEKKKEKEANPNKKERKKRHSQTKAKLDAIK